MSHDTKLFLQITAALVGAILFIMLVIPWVIKFCEWYAPWVRSF